MRLSTPSSLFWGIIDAEHGSVQYSICFVKVCRALAAQMKTVLFSELYCSILGSASSASHAAECAVRSVLLAEADENGLLFSSGPLSGFAGDFFHESVSVLD